MLVIVVLPRKTKNVEERVAELKDLSYSAGLSVLDVVVQRPKELHPKFLVGKGKIEEIAMGCRQFGADMLVFDEELTPSQLNNISSLTGLKVIDRNQLILDIFAARAKTNEAKIQVELAQLRYILPRLAEKEAALSRLTGGIGGRGPGETKLEVNRRRTREKIAFLEKKLEEVGKTRERKRERRRRTGIPVVSIIGYTNSGKSTLLNLLTKSTRGSPGALLQHPESDHAAHQVPLTKADRADRYRGLHRRPAGGASPCIHRDPRRAGRRDAPPPPRRYQLP